MSHCPETSTSNAQQALQWVDTLQKHLKATSVCPSLWCWWSNRLSINQQLWNVWVQWAVIKWVFLDSLGSGLRQSDNDCNGDKHHQNTQHQGITKVIKNANTYSLFWCKRKELAFISALNNMNTMSCVYLCNAQWTCIIQGILLSAIMNSTMLLWKPLMPLKQNKSAWIRHNCCILSSLHSYSCHCAKMKGFMTLHLNVR